MGSVTAVCAVGGVSTLLSACSAARYVAATEKDKVLSVNKADLGKEKYVLVKSEHSKVPIYLTKASESEYLALLLLCTHKQCQVKPAGNYLVCPCHGSEFDSQGKVVTGPAFTDLARYKVTQDDTQVHIHIDQS